MNKFMMGFSCCATAVIGYVGIVHPDSIPLLRYLNIKTPHFAAATYSKTSFGNGRKNADANYKSQVLSLALHYDLPASYLLSLIILECGGYDPCGQRFEPKRFKQLKRLRDGKRRKFEYLRSSDLKGKTDSEIRDYATSWGPFQIMGYHTILLSTEEAVVTIEDLKGTDALDIGVQWVDLNYGTLLREDRYKDAFHMHNTGHLYPKSGKPRTHDPYYVAKGLAHIEYFENAFLFDSELKQPVVIPTIGGASTPSDTGMEVVFIEFEPINEDLKDGDTVYDWQVTPSLE